MSIFSRIMTKIFGGDEKPLRTTEGAPTTAPQAGTTTQVKPPASVAAAPVTAAAPVDVEKVLSDLAAKNPQELNWRESIVDLLKLLDIDSSLANRRELAAELGYTGDIHDSAAMNIWLIKAVMKALAKNGGVVPASLRD